MMMLVLMVATFSACSSDDDGSVSMSDAEIYSTLQGRWDVVQYYPADGQTKTTGKHETWKFSGNKVSAWATSTFTVENGTIYSDAFDGGIVLTRLTSKELEGYWIVEKGEKYYGVKTDSNY